MHKQCLNYRETLSDELNCLKGSYQKAGQWWCRLSLLVLGRWKQAGFYEFEENLVYRTSSRTDRAIRRDPVLKKKKSY